MLTSLIELFEGPTEKVLLNALVLTGLATFRGVDNYREGRSAAELAPRDSGAQVRV